MPGIVGVNIGTEHLNLNRTGEALIAGMVSTLCLL